ncbi:histidinol-phosphate transaminase [Pseudoroseomonas globiformis]|uniref:Histidinol-phosphate aminotransferase n=1 Tax=Teichococcus globiformis TaxID=2307229 RepID=A0ABV7G2M4_9PROT
MPVSPRPSIMTIDPYVGGESKIPGVNRIIKLSSNEGAFGPPPAAIEAITRAGREAHRYPDGAATALREAIGGRFGLDPARIVTGNGSDELISLLCLAYGGEGTEIIMSAYGFMMYDLSGRAGGARVLKVAEKPAPGGVGTVADIDGMIAAAGPRTRIVFLTNPNNPTGTLLPNSELARLRAGLRDDILLVLDSAYAEYVTEPDYDPGNGLVDAAGNTIMLRTFSKVFGLGGMRIGWGYAPAGIIDVMNRVRGPFNVAAASQAAALGALSEPGWVEKSVAHNTEWRGRLSAALSAAGAEVWPSHANFIFADFGSAEAARTIDARLKARGLIVRGMAGYGLPQALRFTVGNAEECQMVIDALGTPHG